MAQVHIVRVCAGVTTPPTFYTAPPDGLYAVYRIRVDERLLRRLWSLRLDHPNSLLFLLVWRPPHPKKIGTNTKIRSVPTSAMQVFQACRR
jgi:hypothetical protein